MADSTVQSFTLDNFDDNGSVGAQYNALLLYQVPEPSAVLICGLGSLTLLRRRRN